MPSPTTLGAPEGKAAFYYSDLDATFIEHVLPILRSRGLFREDYTGTTLREHYGLAKPANQFHERELVGA